MEAIQEQAQAQAEQKPRRQSVTMVPIVKRMVGFKEVHGEHRRVGTIVYEYNRVTHTLRYGASIFRTSADKPETFIRANHLETATKRFNEHPVIVENFQDNTTLRDFHDRIRQLLFTHKCRSWPSVNTDQDQTEE
jgi:hypothetical protein